MTEDRRALRKFMIEEGRKYGEMTAAKTYARLGVDVALEDADQVQTIAINSIVGGEVEFRSKGIGEAEIELWSKAANKSLKKWLKEAIKNAKP